MILPALLLAGQNGARRPNLILISVDTLRRDHVGLYGYRRNTTPNIDRLLKNGTWFKQADCNVPLTGPGFSSMLTSRYPHETGATRNGVAMREGMETLAQLLQQNGYATAAILSNWPLKARISNLAQGFDLYDDSFFDKRWIFFNDERDANEVTERAGAWLVKAPPQPFFLWAHYSDPHSPYLFHTGFVFREPTKPNTDLQRQIDAYDSEVAYADHAIGILLDQIRTLGLDRNSVIVFLADHGESLGERSYVGHGRTLYQNALAVPFGFSGPGLASQRVDAQVELLDFAPTALGMLGLSPGGQMRGRDLSAQLRGESPWPPHFLVYAETYPGAVLGEGAEKLVNLKKPLWVGLKLDDQTVLYSLPDLRWELHNLTADPQELRNLADPANPGFIQYSDHLLKWYRSWEQSIATGATDALTAQDKQKLEALGY